MASQVAGQGATYDDGAGFYANYEQIHQNIYENAEPCVLKALEDLPFKGDLFVICDYGAADGGCSKDLLTKCVGILKRNYGEGQQVQIVYEDQPTNSFNTLFLGLNGLLDDPLPYLEQPGVYVSAIGRSFFKQCLPDNSVHLGFSSRAFNWLSQRPCYIRNALTITGKNVDANEKKLFFEQAEKDWSSILLHRARELAPGASLVVVIPGDNPELRIAGRMKVYETLDSVWSDMRNEGIITQKEFTEASATTYSRSEAELKAPFSDRNSEVYQSGLRLVSLQWIHTEDPFQVKWKENKQNGALAAKEHAKSFADNIKAGGYHAVYEGLDKTRQDGEKQKIMETLASRFVDMVAEDPTGFSYESVHAIIHMKKIKE